MTINPVSHPHVYHYFIDEYGRWFCEGNPVSDVELFRLLSRTLFERNGDYFIRCEGEIHPVHVADAPLWIRYVHVEEGTNGDLEHVEIELEDGRREALAPESLFTGHDKTALYALATHRKLPARFGKSAYYEITRHLRQDADDAPFYLVIAGKRHELHDAPSGIRV